MTIMSEANLSDFVAGFAERRDAAGDALRQAQAAKGAAFAPRDIVSTPPGEPVRPRHFSPADPQADPTGGWDPLDAGQPVTGFIDPIATARAQGYDEGFTAALVDVGQSRERDRAMLEKLVAALADDRRIDRGRLAAHLRSTVLLLVTKMVGETHVDAALLTRRVIAAVGKIADDAEAALLRLNPDDLHLIEGGLPETVAATADGQVARGHFVLESAATIVEDGPDQWLEQLAQLIDRTGLPG